MNDVYLSIGSNLGNRRNNIEKALELLHSDDCTVDSISPIYETEPWGNPDQPHFLNLVLKLSTDLSPEDLLYKIHTIEEKCGRKRTGLIYSPRPMDIDILIYGSLIVAGNRLTIPHPQMTNRLFVLIPMADLVPELRHPVSGETVIELIQKCTDKSKVIKVS